MTPTLTLTLTLTPTPTLALAQTLTLTRCILYLNPEWVALHGGELRIFEPFAPKHRPARYRGDLGEI